MALSLMATDDKAEESGKDLLILPEEVKPHALALGGLLIIFSGLELQLSITLATMLDVEFTSKGDVLGGIELKPKLLLLKSLSFAVGKDKPNDWYNRFSELLRHISNDLCPDRNRMVHDVWGMSDVPGELIRINLKPQVSKQPVALKMDRLSVSVRDIAALSYQVLRASRELAVLTLELKPSLKEKSP